MTKRKSLLGKPFTVIKGDIYRAIINLSFLESMATNEYIAEIFENIGFVDVSVRGTGETRCAEGRWTGENKTVTLDSHIISVSVIATANNNVNNP